MAFCLGRRRWVCWLWRCGLAALLACTIPAAHAERQGLGASRLLLVSQWTETDASGQLRAQSASARVQLAGSTEAGLQSSWSASLDHTIDPANLLLAPIPWVDPLASGSRNVRSSGAVSFDAPYAGLQQDPNAVPRMTSRLLALAARHCGDAAPGLASRLVMQLAAQGASEAWFNLRQVLPIAGRARALVWNFHVDAGGTWFAGTPLLESPGRLGLYVRYTSLSAGAGLPAVIGHADAGWLRWETRDDNGHVIGVPGARDTSGAFDGKLGLLCLIGTAQAADCPVGQEGIPALMDRLGAGHVEFDLVTSLRPSYAVTPQGKRFAIAQLSVTRTLESPDPGCRQSPWRYVNTFRAAFRLEARRESYVLLPPAGWQLRSVVQLRQDTPLLPWRTVAVTLTPAQLNGLDGMVIDPDRSTLVRADTVPAAIQQLSLGPLQCASGKDLR